ncbi:MAG TPA: hypothetical protein VK116_17510, partial [Planctomycetota bacterium]|nr:hypothetical protein [Planctomycetota bacterium]
SAYQGLLVPGLHPVGYLFLDFAPESVDVNVHPTKTEVRFRDSGRVFPFVLRAVRDALADARGELRSARSEADADESAIESLARDEGTFAIASERLETASDGGAALSNAELDRLRVERAAKDFLARGGHADLRSHRSSARQMSFLGGDARKADSVRLDRSRGAGEASYGIDAERSIERSGERTGAPSASKAAPRSAVQVLDTFLLVEEGDGIVLYDQHALHEKILFEDILRRLEGGGIVRQRLIVPEVVTLLPEHVPLLDDALPLLESCGYEVEPFGARDVAVRAVPELFSRVRRMERPAEFLHDAFRLLLESDGGARDDLAQGARALREGPLRALASLLACKQAVKAGTRLRPEEIAALLGRAELADDPENCPHGRPTAVRMSRREIERRFDRR